MSEPKPTQSYFQQAQTDAALEADATRASTYFGRHQTALEDGGRAYLVGSEAQARPPIPRPAYPADPGGADPLGFAIDQVEDMETFSGLPREPIAEELPPTDDEVPPMERS